MRHGSISIALAAALKQDAVGKCRRSRRGALAAENRRAAALGQSLRLDHCGFGDLSLTRVVRCHGNAEPVEQAGFCLGDDFRRQIVDGDTADEFPELLRNSCHIPVSFELSFARYARLANLGKQRHLSKFFSNQYARVLTLRPFVALRRPLGGIGKVGLDLGIDQRIGNARTGRADFDLLRGLALPPFGQ